MPRSVAEISAEIERFARARSEMWRLGVRTEDEVFAMVMATHRLTDLFDEKREALADSQEAARRALNEPLGVHANGIEIKGEKMPWERKTTPLTAEHPASAQARLDAGLRRFRTAAA